MIPELGHFAIILALLFALLQTWLPRNALNNAVTKAAALGQFIFLAVAMLCLIISFLNNDLTVLYVREHSHQLLPVLYRIGAAWGGHEGSLLLWCLILSGWTVALLCFHQDSDLILRILGLISTGFILFLFFTSNPFQRNFPNTLINGNDLTPILQDPGLIFHPPMLYLGYVGFAIGFAFAIAALLQGKLDSRWARACRPWIILPWGFLSCGIVLGSWWAYRELGWGGWWFWDPVENASLLPWISATALLHSLIVCEKRETFKGWTILLAIITFALSLIGTFLVRSGVLVSVHAFASDPSRGLFLLGYLTFIIGGSFLLYGFRIKHFYQAPNFQLLSRETFLLMNSVILLAAVATIVLGTLYPIILDALNIEKISVGEPYFNTVFIPMMLPLLLLMGAAPYVHWQHQSFKNLWQKLRFTLLGSFLCGFLLPALLGFPFYWLTAFGIALGIWIILATLAYAYRLWKTHGQIYLSHTAMIMAHLGIAVLVLGITVNKSYSKEQQVKIQLGESTHLAGYQITFNNLSQVNGPNYSSTTAMFDIHRNNHLVASLSAEQRLYTSHQDILSKPGILVNPWRDIYIALGNALPDNAWSVRIYYKPFVRWIWAGGFMLLLGGVLSLLEKIRPASHKTRDSLE